MTFEEIETNPDLSNNSEQEYVRLKKRNVMIRKSFYHSYNKSVCEYDVNGHPTKCECGCEDFDQDIIEMVEGHIHEYDLTCSNEGCRKIVGYWSYGSWQSLEL